MRLCALRTLLSTPVRYFLFNLRCVPISGDYGSPADRGIWVGCHGCRRRTQAGRSPQFDASIGSVGTALNIPFQTAIALSSHRKRFARSRQKPKFINSPIKWLANWPSLCSGNSFGSRRYQDCSRDAATMNRPRTNSLSVIATGGT